MTVADIAQNCLDYPNVTVADAPTVLPSGARIIRECIFAALAQMYDIGPSLFRLPRVGGVLSAPLETTITIDSAQPWNGTFAVDTTPRGHFCTFRITGMDFDSTIADWNSSVGRETDFSPGYLGATGSPSCTVYHDAFLIPPQRAGSYNFDTDAIQQTNSRLGNCAWVNGEPIIRVASREQARTQLARTLGRNATGTPEYFWEEQRNGLRYVCFYPMPTEATAIAFEVFYGMADIAAADIYASTVDFNLDEKTSREILLPLTIEALMGTPLFANPRCKDVVEMMAKSARMRLDKFRPKETPLPDFRAPRSFR